MLIGGRPLGVFVVALVVLLDAALSFVAAYTTIASAPVDWTAAVLLGLAGTLMVIKAHGLWSYHRVAWLSVQALAAVSASVDAIELVRGHDEPGSWFPLAWNLITIAYLNLPSVRTLYVRRVEPAS